MGTEAWIAITGLVGALVASYVTYRTTMNRNLVDKEIALGSTAPTTGNVAQSTADQVWGEIDRHFERLEREQVRLKDEATELRAGQRRCEARERKMLRALSKAGIVIPGFDDNGNGAPA